MEKKRHSLVAALLNIISPGTGFLYIGRPLLSIGAVFVIPIALLFAGRYGLLFSPKGLLVFTATYLLWWISIAAYAYWLAKKQGVVNLNRFQRWYYYIGFAVVSSIILNACLSSRGMLFGYDIFNVPGSSMDNALLSGDKFISNTSAFEKRAPRRGEIVVFKNPRDPAIKYIKRVVGLPGEKIELHEGKVFANGVQVTVGQIDPENNKKSMPGETSFAIPSNSYFVLGDNRDNSFDSRHFGPVPADHLYGSAEFIWFSVGENGIRSDRIGKKITNF